MAPKFNEGQMVRTVTGGTADILRIEDCGISFSYECVVREGGLSQGIKMIHETKLMAL
jgi:hypothetical protein